MSAAKLHSKTQPFSVRLTDDERRLLEAKANGLPLGLFVRQQVLAGASTHKRRRASRAHADQKILAELLAALGASRIANNLNQLAHAANMGSLVLDVETKTAVIRASDDIMVMRLLLMQGLGLKLPDIVPPKETTSQSFARAAGGGSRG
ncbi:MAG TPA: plasmid mobilization relaxosome protein MobC [Pseudorhizobium sp.]|jgi:type III secretory pathway component EscV|nr:plasmid mobilization relaxosome protein MobC [Pseudorhizobium sp.]